MKKLYLGTNTKMYKTIKDTCEYLERLKALTAEIPKAVELFVIPSYTSLSRAGEILQDSRIRLGAQNMCWEDVGQFTGEISPRMIRETGAQIIEIGHSERRHVFRETDEEENRKVKTALREGFSGISLNGSSRLWIAYEPVWAIGTKGIPASPAYAADRHRAIRETLCGLFGCAEGQEIPILYGGSVNQENACGFLQKRLGSQ